jgi:hypothetical protein
MDNGAYAGFNRAAFERLLEGQANRKHLCRFVALPDVVASARRTLEAFDYWYPRLDGWKRALVAQDGLEGLPIPWDRIDAILHVGRVNTPGRFEYFEALGADSIDGSGLARYTWMREEIYRAQREPSLFECGSLKNA